MGFFSFLKRWKANKTPMVESDPNEFVPALWEDDYCQVEIVSYENQAFIKKQSTGISDLAEKSKSPLGFNESFERGAMPFPTLTKEIRIDYLEYTLSGFGLPKAKHIRYGAKQIFDCASGNTKAFGYYNFIIFFDSEEEFVKNIWITTGLIVDIIQFDLIVSVLYDLGESLEFILIDWDSLELIDLRDRRQIEKYLRGYSK